MKIVFFVPRTSRSLARPTRSFVRARPTPSRLLPKKRSPSPCGRAPVPAGEERPSRRGGRPAGAGDGTGGSARTKGTIRQRRATEKTLQEKHGSVLPSRQKGGRARRVGLTYSHRGGLTGSGAGTVVSQLLAGGGPEEVGRLSRGREYACRLNERSPDAAGSRGAVPLHGRALRLARTRGLAGPVRRAGRYRGPIHSRRGRCGWRFTDVPVTADAARGRQAHGHRHDHGQEKRQERLM